MLAFHICDNDSFLNNQCSRDSLTVIKEVSVLNSHAAENCLTPLLFEKCQWNMYGHAQESLQNLSVYLMSLCSWEPTCFKLSVRFVYFPTVAAPTVPDAPCCRRSAILAVPTESAYIEIVEQWVGWETGGDAGRGEHDSQTVWGVILFLHAKRCICAS